MSSRLDTIADGMVAALGAATVTTDKGITYTKPSGLTVGRSRTIPLSPDVLPQQVVYFVDEEVEAGPGRSIGRVSRRKARFCVETRIDAASDTTDQALDPFKSWSVKALCADPRRAGLAHDTTELGSVWDAVEQDKVYAALRQLFLVEYVTSASDPDAAT